MEELDKIIAETGLTPQLAVEAMLIPVLEMVDQCMTLMMVNREVPPEVREAIGLRATLERDASLTINAVMSIFVAMRHIKALDVERGQQNYESRVLPVMDRMRHYKDTSIIKPGMEDTCPCNACSARRDAQAKWDKREEANKNVH